MKLSSQKIKFPGISPKSPQKEAFSTWIEYSSYEVWPKSDINP